LLPCPPVHPNLAAFAALAVPDEDRAARSVKVALVQIECFADPQSGSPQQNDQRAEALPVWSVSGSAHYGDDLLNRWRVCRVLLAFVPGRSAAVIAGHRCGRAAVAGGV
jgi:hypothetical protein